MGSSSSYSSNAAGSELEGEHFLKITQTTRKQSVIELSRNKGNASKSDVKGLSKVEICFKARIVKYVSPEALWTNFLTCSSNSFALTYAEASSLLLDSMRPRNSNSSSDEIFLSEPKEAQAAIDSFMELIKELSVGDTANVIDFMSLCSSILLLNNAPIERKVDQLFDWITMGDENEFYIFQDLFVTLNSVEKGNSHYFITNCTVVRFDKKDRLTLTQHKHLYHKIVNLCIIMISNADQESDQKVITTCKKV